MSGLSNVASKLGHTPGPWRFMHNYRGGSGLYILNENYRQLADVNQRIAGLERDEAEANARLMAAAPQLLAALKHLVRWHDQLSESDIELARVAIAAAEGTT